MVPDAMTPDVQIDRISIRVPGADRELGRRLGQLVADSLADSLALGPGEASIERLRVELRGQASEGVESLATRVVEQIGLLIAGAGALEAGR
jgi:hypothetical protein